MSESGNSFSSLSYGRLAYFLNLEYDQYERYEVSGAKGNKCYIFHIIAS